MPRRRLTLAARVTMAGADRGDSRAAAARQCKAGDGASHPETGLATGPLLAGIHPLLLGIGNSLSTGKYASGVRKVVPSPSQLGLDTARAGLVPQPRRDEVHEPLRHPLAVTVPAAGQVRLEPDNGAEPHQLRCQLVIQTADGGPESSIGPANRQPDVLGSARPFRRRAGNGNPRAFALALTPAHPSPVQHVDRPAGTAPPFVDLARDFGQRGEPRYHRYRPARQGPGRAYPAGA